MARGAAELTVYAARVPEPSTLTLLTGDADAFLRDAWPHTHRVMRAGAPLLAALEGVPVLEDLDVALRAAPQVAVFDGEGFVPPLRHGPDAKAFYERGRVVYLMDLHHADRRLRRLCVRLAGELGVPPAQVTCEAFWAPGPSVVGLHYDLDLNFNVQLRGRKRWRVAPNRDVEAPLRSHHSRAEMPEGAVESEVGPGDVVFLPHGAWHETRSEGPSLALTFTVKGPRYLDLYLDDLRARLSADPRWRAMALGAAGDPSARAAVAAELDRLIAALPPADGERILARASAQATRVDAVARYAWTGAVRLEGMELVVGDVRFSVDPAMEALARWLAARAEPFALEDALLACPGELPPFVSLVLEKLVARGALERS